MKKDLTSEQRADIARRNGAKSKGPVTPEGKARSSQNAVTHGIYTRNVVTANENAAMYMELRDDYLRHYEPEGRVENDLVLEIVNARWRLARVVTMETAALDCGMARQRKAVAEEFDVVDEAVRSSLAFTGYDGHARNGIALLGRTENRLHRIILRCTAELRLLQRERRDAATPPGRGPSRDSRPATGATEKVQKRTNPDPGTASPANPSNLLKMERHHGTIFVPVEAATVRERYSTRARDLREISPFEHLNPVLAPTHLKMTARHARPLINW